MLHTLLTRHTHSTAATRQSQAAEQLQQRLQDPVHAEQLKFVAHVRALGDAGDWRKVMQAFSSAHQQGHFVDQGEH